MPSHSPRLAIAYRNVLPAAAGTVVNNAGARELLGRAYRAPWKLGA